MKKSLIVPVVFIVTSIFWFSIFSLQSCERSSCSYSDRNDTSWNKICYDYSSQKFNGLSKKLVNDMLDIYKSEVSYANYSPHGNADVDSRAVWFNLDSLKKFIWVIESQARKNHLNAASKLGVRMYFARYPAAANWGDYGGALSFINTNYNKMHTLIMVPTYNNGTYNVDFDPYYFSGNVPSSLLDILASTNNPKLGLMRSVTDQTITAQNHGDLIPPMSGGNYQGAELLQYSDTH